MASTLPNATTCCDPCESPVTVQVPGPAGAGGAAGAAGAAGVPAYTTVAADFTMPGELATVTATVVTSVWMVVGQILWVSRADGSVSGFMQVTAIPGATSVTLRNLKDTSTSAYLSNSAAGTVNIGSGVSAGGKQGASSALTGSAGGQLAGTYPNPTLAKPSVKGAVLLGNGSAPIEVSPGSNGQLLAYDSAVAHGATPKTIVPLAVAGDAQDNRVARLDASATDPVRIQGSKVQITDNGAVQTQGGDTRGADAVDLQATRGASTQVASGANAVLAGGGNNTASAAYATVGGGNGNVASLDAAVVAGGATNQATAVGAAILGGEGNLARSENSAVCGGESNAAGDAGGSNARCFVGGGENNIASGQESVVGGGDSNDATGTQSAVCGGDSNLASGEESFVGGGGGNTASGLDSAVAGGQANTASASYSAAGGLRSVANKYGQRAHSAGMFAGVGDAQASEVLMRRATTDATASELFLDGTSLRLTIPNNTSWMFQLMLVARTSAGLDAIYKSEGLIRNNAATTSVSGVTTTEIHDAASLPATPVVVDADDTNDALRITCTGIVATNIRWVASIRLVEVSY